MAKNRDPISVFIEGKKSWNELYGGALAMAQFWRNMSFLLAVTCVILAGGVIWSSRQTHVRPYVVFAKADGDVTIVNKAVQLTSVPQKILTYSVGRWIQHVREVVDDPLAQKGIYKRIFDHVLAGDPANQATANFINLRSKELLHKHISLTVRIHSILWQSEKTALVQWSETAWLPNGSSVNNGTYEGYVTVKVVPPRATTDSTFQLNPLGIYIEKFSWTRES